MRARALLLSISFAALAACSATPLPDTSTIPPLALGTNEDSELAAIQIAAYVFSDPSHSRNDPVDAARGVASVDFLAGDLYASPRWVLVNPLYKQQMLQARSEVRQAIGVAPNAPSQAVVNGLLSFANAMAAQDPAAARAALASPAFTLGPEETATRLRALPFLPIANIATARVNANPGFGPNDNCFPCG